MSVENLNVKKTGAGGLIVAALLVVAYQGFSNSPSGAFLSSNVKYGPCSDNDEGNNLAFQGYVKTTKVRGGIETPVEKADTCLGSYKVTQWNCGTLGGRPGTFGEPKDTTRFCDDGTVCVNGACV